jgi:hypothetical protein
LLDKTVSTGAFHFFNKKTATVKGGRADAAQSKRPSESVPLFNFNLLR